MLRSFADRAVLGASWKIMENHWEAEEDVLSQNTQDKFWLDGSSRPFFLGWEYQFAWVKPRLYKTRRSELFVCFFQGVD